MTNRDNKSINDAATCDNAVIAPLGEPTEFTTSATGIKLAMRKWLPEGDPKSVILLQHGGAGFHSGYSDILGQAMKANGIAVIAYDQAGCGYSDSIKGLRAYFDSVDALTDDFTKILNDVRQEYPNKKVFAMGESYGAQTILKQMLVEQKKDAAEASLADGYILTGPVIQLLPEMIPPGPAVAVVKFLARFFPMIEAPGTDFFSTFDLAFGDQRWAKAGRADPIIQEAATIPPRIGMISSVLTSMDEVYASLADVKMPIKVLMGEYEQRVDTDAVRKVVEVAQAEDKSFEVVKGAYHQLFQDMPEVTNSVCESVKDWVLERS
eukprot:CAMPEP_0119565888 /NCGR_PEP_ID=MMETSP1352-20130426/31437_1 /TAXON_ID=265584 /ORGANISM="Stauroneis constricta, Strain CCMP1120" /LENGTH=321 /DNA_ID=CAMNT_0007614903 /DNA_START=186 /DNA_END=1151 /DNA_ORIENTATION=-